MYNKLWPWTETTWVSFVFAHAILSLWNAFVCLSNLCSSLKINSRLKAALEISVIVPGRPEPSIPQPQALRIRPGGAWPRPGSQGMMNSHCCSPQSLPPSAESALNLLSELTLFGPSFSHLREEDFMLDLFSSLFNNISYFVIRHGFKHFIVWIINCGDHKINCGDYKTSKLFTYLIHIY